MKVLFIFLISIYSLNAQAPLENISLRLLWLDQFQFAGYYIAKEKGFYKNVGLNVTLDPYEKRDPLYSVTTGESTYGIGRSSLLLNSTKKQNIILLKSLFQVTPLILMGIKHKERQSLQDYKNQKIMTLDHISYSIAFQAMFGANKINMERDTIQIKHSFNIEDLIDNNISLMASYISNEPYRLKKLGYEPIIFSPSDYGFEFYDDILLTTQKEIKQHPKRVENFINASLKGWNWALTHIEESAQIIYNKYNQQDKSLEALIYEGNALKKLALYKNIPLGDINKEKLTRIYDIYKSLGFTKKDIDIASYIYTNPSFIESISKYIKLHFNNGNIIKIFLLFFSLLLAIIYWNWQLKKKVEQEIASRLENERLLFRQHRLVAMGEMMNNIAHQWRQPINNINLLVLNIQNKYNTKKLTNKYLDEKVSTIEDTIEYMSQTINDFSTYLSPNKEKNTFSINHSITMATNLLLPLYKKNQITIDFPTTTLFQYFGYENEFIQVLIILLNNAKDALLKDKENKNKYILLTIEKSTTCTIIKISDNAQGISENHIDQVFDPYFTTSHKKQGKGLGLYIAKMIIEESFDGKITAENHTNGCTFTLYIK